MEYKSYRINYNSNSKLYETYYCGHYIDFDTEEEAKSFIDSIINESSITNYATSLEEDYRDILGYTILTNITLADVLEETEYIDDEEAWDKLTYEQARVLRDRGYKPYNTEYPIKFLNSSDVTMMSIEEALECLYSRNGFDLVEFSDGDIGFLDTFAEDGKSGFKIISDISKYTIDDLDESYDDIYYSAAGPKSVGSISDFMDDEEEYNEDDEYLYEFNISKDEVYMLEDNGYHHTYDDELGYFHNTFTNVDGNGSRPDLNMITIALNDASIELEVTSDDGNIVDYYTFKRDKEGLKKAIATADAVKNNKLEESKKKKKDTDIDYMKDVEGCVKAFNNMNANIDGTIGTGEGPCY